MGVVAFAMGVEIERKFLVRDESWHTPDLPFRHIRQGYLTPPDNPLSIRIRIVDQQTAVITLKSTNDSLSRDEYEYAIPLDDALASGSLIEKTRFIRTEGDARWEIDRFEGENAGLVWRKSSSPAKTRQSNCRIGLAKRSPMKRASETHRYRDCPSAAGEW